MAGGVSLLHATWPPPLLLLLLPLALRPASAADAAQPRVRPAAAAPTCRLLAEHDELKRQAARVGVATAATGGGSKKDE